jgi:hypothetical protein
LYLFDDGDDDGDNIGNNRYLTNLYEARGANAIKPGSYSLFPVCAKICNFLLLGATGDHFLGGKTVQSLKLMTHLVPRFKCVEL